AGGITARLRLQTLRLKTLLFECSDRCRLVVLDIEDRIKFRDLEQIVDFFGQIEQLQLTALIADRGEGTDQFADPRAVNVGNIAQVQQDLLLSLAQQVANRVAEHHTAFSQSDAATHVHDGDAVYLPT